MAVTVLEGVSHTDHNLTPEQTAWVLSQVKNREGFFIQTLTLPENLGTVPCGLHGPLTGSSPIPESEVFYAKRGNRDGESRMCNRAPVQVREVSIICGPHEHEGKKYSTILYTMFGGPVSPREPFDASIADNPEAQAESREFWAQHALSA